jgi:putative YhbY family RNA-binding protein
MPLTLTARERTHLKARAHSLEPSVLVGHEGLTDGVVTEIDRALAARELIKVRVLDSDRDAREKICTAMCERTNSAEVQRVGKVIVLWRPKPNEGEP